MTITPIEFIGAFFGVLGTALLAVRCRYSGWGFVAYLVSNAAWIVFALQQKHDGMLVQQIVFVVSSLVGVWVWLVRPRWPAILRCIDSLSTLQLVPGKRAAAAIDADEWQRRYAARLIHHGWNERLATKESAYAWASLEDAAETPGPEKLADLEVARLDDRSKAQLRGHGWEEQR
ncbi:MAG: nicotinamide mononucleotide transporter [Ramlibacter sp.]